MNADRRAGNEHPVADSTRGLLKAVCNLPLTSAGTQRVFGAILRAGLLDRVPAVKPVSRAAAKPRSGWRYLPLYDGPQLSDERWDQLATSQAQAVELLKDGAIQAALRVLQVGTWHNAEEELRQLLIHVHAECEQVDERGEAA